MPFTAVHGICLCQRVLELPDAVGQDADLVMKHLGVREDETVARYFYVSAVKFRDKGNKKAHRLPLPVVKDPEWEP